MKTKFLTMLMSTTVFSLMLAAEDVDPASKCETSYNSCVEKCDMAADGSETCYRNCDRTYEKCLSPTLDNNTSQS